MEVKNLIFVNDSILSFNYKIRDILSSLDKENESYTLVSTQKQSQSRFISKVFSRAGLKTYIQNIVDISCGDFSSITVGLSLDKIEDIKRLRRLSNESIEIVLFDTNDAQHLSQDTLMEFYDNSKKIKKLSSKIKSVKKELKEIEKEEESSKEKELLKEKIKSLNKKLEKKELYLKSVINRPGLIYYLYWIGRNSNIEYICNDFMVIKKGMEGRLLSNSEKIDFLNKLILDGFSRELEESEIVEKIKTYLKPTDLTMEFKNLKSVFLYADLKDMISEEVDIESSLEDIDMKNISPLAPVKPNIAASMIASGAGGKISKEVEINGEKILIKSVMARTSTENTIVINGVKKTEKTYTWNSQLGIFNKLRKEVEILRD